MERRIIGHVGVRIPYRVVYRDARFHVIRLNLKDALYAEIAQVIGDSPSVSDHATEMEAERWVRDAIQVEYDRWKVGNHETKGTSCQS